MRMDQPSQYLNDTTFRCIERECTLDHGLSQVDLEVGKQLHVLVVCVSLVAPEVPSVEAEELFVEVLKTTTNVLVVESCPSMALNCKLAILQGK